MYVSEIEVSVDIYQPVKFKFRRLISIGDRYNPYGLPKLQTELM